MSVIMPDALSKACVIFFRLVKEGKIDGDIENDLLKDYSESDVSTALAIMERESGVKIMSYENNLYIFPYEPDSFFDMKNEEIKHALKVQSNTELYICYFIILVLLSRFFSCENADFDIVEGIEITKFMEYLNELANDLARRDDLATVSEVTELALSHIVLEWNRLLDFDARSNSNREIKRWYVEKVLNYLSLEKLLFVEKDVFIRITPKLSALMRYYYHSDEKRQYILNYLKVKQECNSNA